MNGKEADLMRSPGEKEEERIVDRRESVCVCEEQSRGGRGFLTCASGAG